MKLISDVTCCVVDSGLFVQTARRMAEDCKRVLYWNPDTRAFPSMKQEVIGYGCSGVEWVSEFWPHISDIDLFVFPDSSLSGLQLYLESTGKAVWGSRHGQDLEQSREMFMGTLADLGLEVPPHVTVHGLKSLREYLRDTDDAYVKVSHLRGDLETKHWRGMALDEGWLDWIAITFGPLKEKITFLVFDAIETDLEIGADGYCIDGEYPSLMLSGTEWKDRSYFASVTPTRDLPEHIVTILDAFAPMLREFRYRNQMSMEVRVKGDKAYFIDDTRRAGMPSTASQHLLWRNFPEIVWAGANGELVDPEPKAKFSIEVMVTSKDCKDLWDAVEIPKSLEPWCRFSNCGFVDGRYVFPPDSLSAGDLGWLGAIGDTPEETLQAIKGIADQLPPGLNADVEALSSVFKEIDSAKSQGLELSQEPVPEPESVMTDE